MTNREQILDKFTRLLAEGREIMARNSFNGREWRQFPATTDYLRFRTESLNLIQRVCGEQSGHYRAIDGIAKDGDRNTNSYYFSACFGILEAAYNDFQQGLLFDLRSLISAELLGDFLEQAEVLYEEGYVVPAASLTGAVLEDSLKKLCEKHGITVPSKTKIDSLNAELAKNSVYSKLIQKEITAKADIRNNADHGNFDKVKPEDVRDMIVWVRRFESDHLG